LARAALVGSDVKDVGVTVAEHLEITQRSNTIIDQVVASTSGLHVLDPLPFLSRDGICFAEYEGKALYYDRQHLTITGAGLLEPMFTRAFSRLRRPSRSS
ncbi:MAG TPA: SGNH hydrolase domain-containing protein, partial [Candidatus Synoicihabitans sp.]|nr:SGNH hydrolase domain-containing protein [Candidatus Synoicihabitans sp.]